MDDDAIRTNGISPWGVEQFGLSAGSIERDILFVHGYPEEKSTWVPINPQEFACVPDVCR